MSLSRMRKRWLLAIAALLAPTVLAPARASDHADTAENYNRIGADLTDLFVFPSPTNPGNVVLVMDVRGLIPAGQAGNVSFDPRVLYQFKIDTSGDNVEDLVIQAKFEGVGRNQRVRFVGPIKPPTVGTTSILGRPSPMNGRINLPFSPAAGVTVFAGAREDPFFIDLEQFFKIFPDRGTPLTGRQVDLPDPNTPKAPGFRSPGVDFLADMNVLSIIVEMPRARLAPAGGRPGVIRVWETTSIATGSAGGFKFQQQDRLANPVVNEVLATVSFRRHEVNNKDNPTDDPTQLKNDIESFLTFPAGRSRQIKDVIESVLVPDTMVADLSQDGPAAYLGVQTGGATGGKFGGRKLIDDVVDISLYVVFGTAISDLGLAPDDGQAKPSYTSDNVGPGAKHFLNAFPYLGDPR